jgi:5'-methylthioadenosine phosphorylase
VGSLRQEIAPLDLVVPNQLIDRTKSRVNSFFEDGLVVHAGFAHPFCAELAAKVSQAARATGRPVHEGGTLVVMEGPLFSTKAESELYRSWGAHLIGMTALPEAKLAREAEMCYATLACATDYDVWHPEHDHVTVEMVVKNLLQNVDASKRVIRDLASAGAESPVCACEDALASAIITDRSLITAEHRRKYGLFINRHLGA